MSDAPKTPPFTLPRPGPEHEVLLKDVGTWDATVEIRFAPGAPPQVTTGIMESRLVCDGLWLVSDFKSQAGFAGHGVHGYDAERKKYVGTWVDSMSTVPHLKEGEYDAGKRTMTMWSEATIHGRPMRWRETTETKESNTTIWRQFMPGPDGKELETMTVTYTRRR